MSGEAFSAAMESVRRAREEGENAGYGAGQRAAWQSLLQSALGQLLSHPEMATDPLVLVGRLTLQLERARAALRQVCRIYGDNDWPDDLDLGDVIQKHLHQYLDEAQGD